MNSTCKPDEKARSIMKEIKINKKIKCKNEHNQEKQENQVETNKSCVNKTKIKDV